MNFSKILGWFSFFLIAGFLGLIIINSEIFFGEQICNSGFEISAEDSKDRECLLRAADLAVPKEKREKFCKDLEAIPLMTFDDNTERCETLLIDQCGEEVKILDKELLSLANCKSLKKSDQENCFKENLLSFKKIGVNLTPEVAELDFSKEKNEIKLFSEILKNKKIKELQSCTQKVGANENCMTTVKPKQQEIIEPLRACTGSETIMYGIKFVSFNILRAVFRAF